MFRVIYVRQPTDLPSSGREVRLSVRVRRFYCHNHTCSKQTFTEPLRRLLKPYARRTQRLAKAQGRIGIALGGDAAARLLVHLAMPASADTILRLVRDQPLPTRQPPRIVGVDDWAMKKGRTYSSILVDLERRKPIELLPDRTATTFSAWLRRTPMSGSSPVTAPVNTPAALPRPARPSKSRIVGICC